MHNAAQVRADFDTLAQFSHDEAWSHNSHYHAYLLKHLPAHLHTALDIGCGTGLFSRLLAQRTDHVTGFDLSPQMIEVAQSRSTAIPNIAYQVQDITTWDAPTDQYDCIASIATLHHIPPDAVYPKVVRALKPGGILLVLDLYTQRGLRDLLSNLIVAPLSYYYKWSRNGHIQPSAAESAAWQEHGKHDIYPTMDEVRRTCAQYLPGAQVRQHWLWRYSIVWHK